MFWFYLWLVGMLPAALTWCNAAYVEQVRSQLEREYNNDLELREKFTEEQRDRLRWIIDKALPTVIALSVLLWPVILVYGAVVYLKKM